MCKQVSRYRYYRVHKFVIPFINDATRLIAKTDFREVEQVSELNDCIQNIIELMKAHAKHEDDNFHRLLKEKGSNVYQKIEEDHKNHDAVFKDFNDRLNIILSTEDADERISLGQEFYLVFRQFEADNLHHLNAEETLLMPELQKLYTDDELKQTEAEIYANKMNVDQMIGMLSTLFPYMSPDDHLFFLTNIKDAAPDKFEAALQGILNAIDSETNDPIIKPVLAKQYREHFDAISMQPLA